MARRAARLAGREQRLAALGRARVEAALRRRRRRRSRAGRTAAPPSFGVTRSGSRRTCCRSRSPPRSETCSRRRGADRRSVPLPCISSTATNAFQCVTEPQPVQVWRFTPARPKAGGISVAAALPSGREALPSSRSSASNLPGPQLVSTVAHGRLVDAEQLRERRDARRERDDLADVQVAVRPAVEPRADAGSERVVDRASGRARTWMPTDSSCAAAVREEPRTPTTALSWSSASVDGRIVEIRPARLEAPHERRAAARRTSTLRPSASAALRAQARADAAVRGARDRLVQASARRPRTPRRRTCRSGTCCGLLPTAQPRVATRRTPAAAG